MSKNLHMTHLDELLFDIEASKGETPTTKFLSDVVTGESNITVKWDGAPAIFVGTDPQDGKFFVGTKAIFNKEPKIIKEPADIERFRITEGLKPKLLTSLIELRKLNIPKGVILQGDLLFTDGDITNKTIDGVEYITFQPNTILYAVKSDTEIAKKMTRSKIGVVFHTTYTGESLPEMEASFGADISNLTPTKDVWFIDASYEGNIGCFDRSKVTEIKSREKELTESLFDAYSEYIELQSNLTSAEIGAGLKTFFNRQIREGKIVENGEIGYDEFINHFRTHFEEKVIAKLKNDTSREFKTSKMVTLLESIMSMKPFIIKVIDFTLEVMDVKRDIIKKLENGINTDIKTFVINNGEIRETKPEGFVAIDKTTGGAVKFVDRLEFSNLNFNVDKNWSK